jgi:hypothetical protein
MTAIHNPYANRPRSSQPWADGRVRGMGMAVGSLPSRFGEGFNSKF